MSADFFQLGYVTNDFDRAMDELRALHDLGPFKEMRDTHLPTRPGHEAIAHFGLAFKGDLQFEVIAPTGGDSDIYREPLPAGQFALRYHHLGRYLSVPEEYQRLLETYSARWEMPVRCSAFGGFYAYADARKDVGHFLEIFTFPTDFFDDVPRY
jgi:Glyoxalase/Bleomycin resistance protein/Dioxygenase superfamily